MELILKVENLSKTFNHRIILNDVSFSMAAGDCTALLGPNGSGKTTLLKLLSGVMKPQKGSGSLFNQPLFKANYKYRIDLIYLGHAPMLYPALTAIENLRFFFQIRREIVLLSEIQESLDEFGLLEQSNEPVRNFSAGMLQRLNLVRLGLSNWQLALLDEPNSVLDQEGLQILNTLLLNWKSQGKSILFSTHDVNWAKSMSTKGLILSKAKLNEVSNTGMGNADSVN